MKIIFEEWHCSNIEDSEKKKIEDDIEEVIHSNKGDMKFIPKILTVSIFEDPLAPILKGSGIDENGVELVKFTRPQIKGEHNYQFIN